MTTVTFEIPAWIAEGLANGTFERVGGVVRRVADKKVVAWLREGSQVTQNISNLATPAAILNLGLTSMSFAIILHRLNEVEKRLQDAQKLLARIDTKIDILFFANFRAALDLAINAFSMMKADNRKSSALQAINRFIEARHQYLVLTDTALAERNQVVDEYLSVLALAYVSEAQCYLELEEIDTARRVLQAGSEALRSRVVQYVSILLTSNPAAYLHPELQGLIDLRRLTAILRWQNPELDENAVFELHRTNLFELARNPQSWIDSLPPAVWNERLDEDNTAWFWQRGWKQLTGTSRKEVRIFERLPVVIEQIEAMIEDTNRVDGYTLEVQTLQGLGVNFHDWRQLGSDSQADLICITQN